MKTIQEWLSYYGWDKILTSAEIKIIIDVVENDNSIWLSGIRSGKVLLSNIVSSYKGYKIGYRECIQDMSFINRR